MLKIFVVSFDFFSFIVPVYWVFGYQSVEDWDLIAALDNQDTFAEFMPVIFPCKPMVFQFLSP